MAATTLSPHGYETSLFENVPEWATCCICSEVLREPSSCLSGHSFCSDCIKTWLRSKSTCPVDRGVLTAAKLVPNLGLLNALSSLSLRCPNVTDAAGRKRSREMARLVDSVNKVELPPVCSWSGTLGAFEAHLAACPAAKEECKWECGSVFYRGTSARSVHEPACDRRFVTCPNKCGKEVKFCWLASHKEKRCRKQKLCCTNVGCSLSPQRRHFEAHLRECHFRSVRCTVPGCGRSVAACLLLSHLRSTDAQDVHLVVKHMLQLQRSLKAARAGSDEYEDEEEEEEEEEEDEWSC